MSCEYVIGIPHIPMHISFFKIRFWNPLIEHRGLICKYHLTPIESVLHLIAQAVSMVMRYQVPPGGRKEGHMPDSLVVTTAAVPLRKYKLVSNRCRFERRGRRNYRKKCTCNDSSETWRVCLCSCLFAQKILLIFASQNNRQFSFVSKSKTVN